MKKGDKYYVIGNKKDFNNENNHWFIKVEGEVDVYTAGQLKEVFNAVIEEKKENIKINANRLEYIDSTGLGILIGALKN